MFGKVDHCPTFSSSVRSFPVTVTENLRSGQRQRACTEKTLHGETEEVRTSIEAIADRLSDLKSVNVQPQTVGRSSDRKEIFIV